MHTNGSGERGGGGGGGRRANEREKNREEGGGGRALYAVANACGVRSRLPEERERERE